MNFLYPLSRQLSSYYLNIFTHGLLTLMRLTTKSQNQRKSALVIFSKTLLSEQPAEIIICQSKLILGLILIEYRTGCQDNFEITGRTWDFHFQKLLFLLSLNLISLALNYYFTNFIFLVSLDHHLLVLPSFYCSFC